MHDRQREPTEEHAAGERSAPRSALDEAVQACQAAHGGPHALLALTGQAMFEAFARDAMGTLVVDREHRVVWISEGYLRFLPGLGFTEPAQFVGKRVEDVVPNTLMAQVIETGQPILVDLLTNQAGSFLV
ncbi:MAG TPA: hypothetical protein VLM87_09670, partial [Rubrivivax sp.]|nr:hypothetical protein [Rubrivivax sp.]